MDTSERGDLKSCTLLTEFSLNPKSYSMFSVDSSYTYSFNVYDEGNILEIVVSVCTCVFFFNIDRNVFFKFTMGAYA